MPAAHDPDKPAAPPLDGSALSATPGSQDRSHEHDGLDRKLFIAVCLILALLGPLGIVSLGVQIHTYLVQIRLTTDTSAILSFTRALDAAILKTSGLFLGYVLVFTGALYTLRIATAHYRLSVKSGRNTGNLDTSSPGLVMLTLGVLLVIAAILSKTTVEYGQETINPSSGPPAAHSAPGHVSNSMAPPGGLGQQ